ncbi:MAG: co-chaperone GroES [Clostridia bacterium]|nr:co-chaperone GroES [Clostridia bacterium]
MILKPLLDKVVLKKVEATETTKAGIILPGSAQEKPQVSVIVAVGPGGLVDGKEVVMTLKTGDKVITGKYTGTEVKLDGVDYTIVSQSDILAVVED